MKKIDYALYTESPRDNDRAEFSVRGKIYHRGGFSTPETAHQWALTEKQRVIYREGLDCYLDNEDTEV